MSITAINEDGALGYRWGDDGTVFKYTAGDADGAADAQRRAFLQGLAAGETSKMNSTELDAARALAEHIGVELRKDASGNLIIGWFLAATEDGAALANQLAIAGGEAPEDLHLTLLYLGDPMQYDVALIGAALKIWTTMWNPWPLEGVISGQGRFVGEDDTDVLLALPDIPGLESLRESLCEILCQVGVFVPYSGHGYTPHITLAYVPRLTPSPEPYPETIPFALDNITVAAGLARASFELAEPDWEEETAAPYFAARAAKFVEKAGRVLSGRNLKLVENAREALALLEAAARKGELVPDEETAKMLGGSDEEGLEYTLLKDRTRDEDRYTFGPLYAPERKDAHGEWTDAESLQKAVWDYVRNSAEDGRRINLQHEDSGASTIGEWVEVVAWPYETTITVKTVDGGERELTMPAGTVFMGIQWDEAAWEEGIKKGKLNGLSLGGRAMRVEGGGDMEDMGDKLAAAKSLVAKGWHEYTGEADGACETCNKSFKDGTHVGNGAEGDPAAKKAEEIREEARAEAAAEQAKLLAKIRELAEEDEKRHEAELLQAREDATRAAEQSETRSLVTQLIDTVKAAVGARPADVHVHLPEQNVTINEAPLDPVEDG